MQTYNVLNVYSKTHDEVLKIKEKTGESIVTIVEKAVFQLSDGIRKIKKNKVYKDGYVKGRADLIAEIKGVCDA